MLAQLRLARDAARQQLSRGIDPAQTKIDAKRANRLRLRLRLRNDFEAVGQAGTSIDMVRAQNAARPVCCAARPSRRGVQQPATHVEAHSANGQACSLGEVGKSHTRLPLLAMRLTSQH